MAIERMRLGMMTGQEETGGEVDFHVFHAATVRE